MAKEKIIIHPITGEKTTYNKIAEGLGIRRRTLDARVAKYGLKEAVTSDRYAHRYKKIITHPETGESGTVKYWVERLNIPEVIFRARLKRGVTLKTFAPHRKTGWSQEEDDYLAEVYDAPNLCSTWNRKAKKQGWNYRNIKTLEKRIKFLRDKSIIQSSSRQEYQDGESSWITLRQLAVRLDVGEDVIYTFHRKGMKAIAYGETKKYKKVYLGDFVKWALGDGRQLVARAIASNPIGAYWLLTQISLWLP